jgi:nucleotide-binding universal stress UspA family protein
MESAPETRTPAGVTEIAHVLVPLDRSARAEAILGWLPLLPIQRLTLLHVCEEDSPDPAGAAAYLDEIAARRQQTEGQIETRVVTGGAAEAIVEAAADVDLVVMSTRGAGGGGRLLFGSVADRVARHSPAPTLLLRRGPTPVSAETVRRVVVPLDGSENAQRALPFAATLATVLSCDAHLVRVVDPGADAPGIVAAERDLERCAEMLRQEGLTTSIELRSGAAAPELLALVTPGDLLVMSTHGQGAAKRWQISRVAEKLLRQAAAPVVLVRADTP